MAEESGIKKAVRPKRRAKEEVSAGPEQPETTGVVSSGVDVPPPPTSIDDGRKKSLNIPLRDDGTVDFDGMRPSTREKYEKAVGPATAAPVTLLTGSDVAPLFDGLGTLQAWCAVKFFGIPADLARALQYDKEEKEMLCEPSARIIQKHLPAMSKWKDEAAVLFLLYSITQQKITLINARLAELAIAAQNGVSVSVPSGVVLDKAA